MPPQNKKRFNLMCEIFVRTYDCGVLSLGDRYILRQMLLEDSLDEEGKRIVNRILHAVQRKWIQLSYQPPFYRNYQDLVSWQRLAQSWVQERHIFFSTAPKNLEGETPIRRIFRLNTSPTKQAKI